jgi:hypothetical protein
MRVNLPPTHQPCPYYWYLKPSASHINSSDKPEISHIIANMYRLFNLIAQGSNQSIISSKQLTSREFHSNGILIDISINT